MDSGNRTRVLGHRLTLALLLIAGISVTPAVAVRLLNVRTASHGDSLRIVLDLGARAPARLTSLSDGREWRVLVSGVVAENPLHAIHAPRPWLDAISSGLEGDEFQIRIRGSVGLRANPFWIPGGHGKPWRYVIDLAPADGAPPVKAPEVKAPETKAPDANAPAAKEPVANIKDPVASTAGGKPPAASDPVAKTPATKASSKAGAATKGAAGGSPEVTTPSKVGSAAPSVPLSAEPGPSKAGKWRILIDPGHGGNDPGARRGNLIEKEIVLDVGRRLAAILNGSKECEAHLSRGDDRRIGLRERHQLADSYEADAFVSIHVNAAPAKRALGVEVFFLSVRGASDEASRDLASLENEADPSYVFDEDSLLQGIPFSFDLRQSDTLLRSSRLAESILGTLEDSHLAASRGVKQAGFGVLKSFQVPSVLVEIGFLSNPEEGKRLANPGHRQDLAESIAGGVIAYFDKYAPARLESSDPR